MVAGVIQTNQDDTAWADGDDGFEPTQIDGIHHVGVDEIGQRLDKLAGQCFDGFSRSTLQKWIDTGELTVNGGQVKAKYLVKLGDVLRLTTTLLPHSADLPEDIDLAVVYEDDDVLVINKPCGLVVHPGAGNPTGTLVNALLYHYPNQQHLPRAGLVHRIDKDTTGLLLVAKTAAAQLSLIEQLKDKRVYRHYQCVVAGTLPQLALHRQIELPIARHATQRTKMAVRNGGKPALTFIRNITPLGESFCLLDVELATGRTHQIRVHLSHIGHGLVGDTVYQNSPKRGVNAHQLAIARKFARQALHACTLGFCHPVSQKHIQVSCPLPDDMAELIAQLQA